MQNSKLLNDSKNIQSIQAIDEQPQINKTYQNYLDYD
jgi:hypothetical protein